MKNTKPLIGAALVCEKVLTEKDGVSSAIRIIDTFHINVTDKNNKQIPIPEAATVPVNALVVLKSGDFSGEGTLTVSVQTPDGTRTDVPEKWNMRFTGGEQGNNLIMNFSISARHIGLTWVEIIWNAEVLARIPIRLIEAGAQPAAN